MKQPKDTATFHFYNANPKNNRAGDCVIRAISTATDKSWDEIFTELTKIAIQKKRMPNDPLCYKELLKKFGWEKEKQPRKEDNTKYTGAEFCRLLDSDDLEYQLDYHGSTNSIIAHIGGHHIVCIKYHENKHKVFDTWNSTAGCIGNYWTKKF